MSVYRVTLKAKGVRATFDGVEIPCGFFKNEFVWARDSEQAIAKARASVETALRRNTAVNQTDLMNLKLEVDEVEAGLSMTSLLQRQGFIFHRLDDKEGDDS
jgi:DNA/RNA endonuclease G (NUC1)